MIRETDISDKELSYSDIYEGKIKTLYRAYGTNYDFCRFLTQDNALIVSKLDRDFVIKQVKPEFNAEELAAYLKACRAASVFLPDTALRALEPYITGEFLYNNLMEFSDYSLPLDECGTLDENPDLDSVYEILRHDFNIIRNSWLPDASHRIRRNISKAMVYNGVSTVTVLYDEDGTVFLTQVATLAAARGKGAATNMLRTVAKRYEGKRLLLVCRDKMLGFYEKTGFKKIGTAAQIYRLDY